MSVVQRCPNCGTIGATPGECEACHEATLRYFCTNHVPGAWLDAPACPACGERFGRAPAPAPDLPVGRRTPAPAGEPAARSVPPPLRPRVRSPSAEAASSRAPDWRPPVGEDRYDAAASRMAVLETILRAGASARSALRSAPARELGTVGRGMGGCLMRMMLLMVVLLLALAGSLFLFGRALFF